MHCTSVAPNEPRYSLSATLYSAKTEGGNSSDFSAIIFCCGFVWGGLCVPHPTVIKALANKELTTLSIVLGITLDENNKHINIYLI